MAQFFDLPVAHGTSYAPKFKDLTILNVSQSGAVLRIFGGP